MSRMFEAADEAAALELLHAQGRTDGLPVVIPTPERVQALIASMDLASELVLGEMGPKQGAASVEKVAVAAVMAGCLPEYFPVVVAAVTAVCREQFDLTEVNQTTHCLAPLIIVNGPARNECGPIGSGAGILGPGNRANASIGRALSLAIINIGGRRSGVTDMAIFSTPGKFTACFAEAEEISPFEPWHVSRGYAGHDSIATVIGVEAPHSVIHEPEGDDSRDAARLIKAVAGVIANPGSNHVYRGGEGGLVVVLCPEHAALLNRAGYDRQATVCAIAEKAVMPRDYAVSVYGGLMLNNGGQDELRAVRDPGQIMLVVAGGMGTYSMVLPSWAYAPNGNRPVSEPIRISSVCDPPFVTGRAGS